MHPSGTFYLDTYLFFVLIFIWREFGDLRSESAFSPLVLDMFSAWEKGLVWILSKYELPKVNLKCDKVCWIRYDAALQDPMSKIPMVLSYVDKCCDTVREKSSEVP